MDIINVPSPNFSRGRRGYRPEAVVIHIMEGTLGGTDSWFRNPQSRVSAHYGIGMNGEVHRYVQEPDTAWHAGRINAPQWTLVKPSSGSGMYVNPNYYTIGIEHEGNNESEWTDAMYEASAGLVADICSRWNISLDRSHVIGHREIYSLKTCPGIKVDLDKIVRMAKQKAGAAVPSELVTARGSVVTKTILNLRKNSPSTASPVARTVPKGTQLDYAGYTETGQKVSGVSRWYSTEDGLWFWGGGVETSNAVRARIKGGEMSTDCNLIRNCVRQAARQMCFAGTNVSDDVIGSTKIADLHLGQASQMPGVSPLAAFVVRVGGCTDVNIPDLTEAKLNSRPNWTVDNLSAFVCESTKIIKDEL